MVYNLNDTSIHHEIVILDDLPVVDTFIGLLDLKTGSLIIAAICVLHPLVYGCTLFMPISYLLITIWFLLMLFFIGSILLFWAVTENDSGLIGLWIWYSLLFVILMVLLLLILALIYTSRKQGAKVAIVLLGVLWYLVTVYFIIVVNSHRLTILEVAKKSRYEKVQKSPDLTEKPGSHTSDTTGSSDVTNDPANSDGTTEADTTEPETTTEPTTSEDSADTPTPEDNSRLLREVTTPRGYVHPLRRTWPASYRHKPLSVAA